MAKKEKKDSSETKGKKDDVSIDWFEDHESYEESEDEEVLEEASERMDDFFEEEDNFNQRVNHFLANQKKDVSLEKMLEFQPDTLEQNFSQRKKEERVEESKIEYIPKNEEENQTMYKPVPVDTHFSKPEMSTAERVLEEQKSLYKHIGRVGHAVGQDKNELGVVRPEDTMKKDYLSKIKS